MENRSALLRIAQEEPARLPHEAWAFLLGARDEEAEALYAAAYAVKVRTLGKNVYLRGLIEHGNTCAKNCFYCGIRRDNHAVKRYEMRDEEVYEAAQFALQAHYGSIVLQSGEHADAAHVAHIETLLRTIKARTDGKLGITISLGEQSFETLQRWFNAGAHRALIRIEASDPERYAQLHPHDALHAYARRVESIRDLRTIGYQVGSGVLIGVPGQTDADLAADLDFLRRMDVDMIGMGPFIPHPETPLKDAPFVPAEQLRRGLNMIACARLMMPRVNIASTTALQTLDPHGREKGLLSGGNVIMPNITPVCYRENYALYQGKPSMNENAQALRDALVASVESIGEHIAFDTWGDPQHFFDRQDKKSL